MEAAAAKAYLALFQASHKATPYSKSILRANSDHLADRVSTCGFLLAVTELWGEQLDGASVLQYSTVQ
jgi:hypothetical protein